MRIHVYIAGSNNVLTGPRRVRLIKYIHTPEYMVIYIQGFSAANAPTWRETYRTTLDIRRWMNSCCISRMKSQRRKKSLHDGGRKGFIFIRHHGVSAQSEHNPR